LFNFVCNAPQQWPFDRWRQASSNRLARTSLIDDITDQCVECNEDTASSIADRERRLLVISNRGVFGIALPLMMKVERSEWPSNTLLGDMEELFRANRVAVFGRSHD
jgi:hypothetical protein